ncbi:hypothetical protein [Scytonema sp. PRP1]|uniref:hypothetical protein n=1 Tax=Scytonema sp. PRP1 TaxID=3120513 RepID=UPI00300BFDBC
MLSTNAQADLSSSKDFKNGLSGDTGVLSGDVEVFVLKFKPLLGKVFKPIFRVFVLEQG